MRASAAEQILGNNPTKAEPVRMPSLEKEPKSSALTEANLMSLVKKDGPPQQKKEKEHFELEHIDNYKGKSLEELEAILDAHNQARAPKPTTKRVSSENRQVGKEALPTGPLKNRRQSATGAREVPTGLG